ncbi:uncharacterized protein DNG_01276 [Cephalotrichum gorgonifer]|uniref:Uncharacterized protein n=1 Tax=Cephalotrichum gorgonifer TaxID=2041049 RepID=A0AAE8MSS4_9PEZI|nr:uncharacterized protein DNG_01276 [Cephalotrichum gorgonifer]
MATRAAKLLLLITSCLLPVGLSEFITPFEGVVEGGKLELTWERLPAEALPFYISGRVFNTTEVGITSFQANLTTNLSTSSFTWSDIPYPLPYIPTAHYELELVPLRPSNHSTSSNQSTSSATAKSPLFSIAPSSSEPPPKNSPRPPGPAPTPTEEKKVSKSSGPGTNAIIAAVCVGLGIPILIAAGVCVWWTRRHRQRAKYEENRRRRYETIID